MLNDEIKRYLLPMGFNAAVRAGAAIMEVYRRRADLPQEEHGANCKSEADRAANAAIRAALGPTRIPVMSEDGRELSYDERRNWELYWLVDPLDGSREFIRGNNEFTVNIALMENNLCVGAAVYVPYLEQMYLADRGNGAYRCEGIAPDPTPVYTYDEVARSAVRLPLATTAHTHPVVAVSRSYNTPETYARIDELRHGRPDLTVVEQGSSYKFCMLADGRVDCYVRTTHTYEWDTAAGELILHEAGGRMVSLPDGEPFSYNKPDLRNPWFICRSRDSKL